MKVEFWTLLGSGLTVTLGIVVKRLIEWYFPPGHHSKRVSRYGVRNEIEQDTEEEDQE